MQEQSQLRGRIRHHTGKFWLMSCIAAATMGLGLNSATAQEDTVSIELNKLEPQGGQCRAYFVVNNKSGKDYEELKLDLVLFKPDGVIGRRFAIDLAPLKANKRTVKLFDIEGTACDEVGSFLINDAMECKAESGPVADCLNGLALSTLTNVQLSK
ncbi:MAG: hypothetical protein ACOYB4_03260 [Methyloceanibacter sp.]